MDRASSATFRKTYAKLTEPTEVTVNGHVIGTWLPGSGHWSSGEEVQITAGAGTPLVAERYDLRPIRPVPKKR